MIYTEFWTKSLTQHNMENVLRELDTLYTVGMLMNVCIDI